MPELLCIAYCVTLWGGIGLYPFVQHMLKQLGFTVFKADSIKPPVSAVNHRQVCVCVLKNGQAPSYDRMVSINIFNEICPGELTNHQQMLLKINVDSK